MEKTHPAIVLLQAAPGVEAPVGALTSLLAQALATGFGDAVLVVHLKDPSGFEDESQWSGASGPPSMSPSTSIAGPASRTPIIDLEDGQAGHLDLSLPADPRRAMSLLCDKLRQVLPLFAYVLLDASEREPALRKLLVMALASPELQGVVRRLVLLTRGDSTGLPPCRPRGRCW